MSTNAIEETPNDIFWQLLGIPSSGAPLIFLIQAGLPFVVFEQLASVFQLQSAQLRKWLSISPSTLRRRRLVGHFNTQESDRIVRVAEALRQMRGLFEGDLEKAQSWMSSPQRGLGGRQPQEMLSTAVETQALLNLIGQIEYGVLS